MSKTTRKYDRFQYFEEDCLCCWCLNYQGKKRGCKKQQECCCEDVRADAVAQGRIKRKRGWNKNWAG